MKTGTRSWFFSILAGAVTSAAATVVIVVWEWLENPGGIFRNADGTNWEFVLETAASWLVPTFVYVTALAAALHWAWSRWQRRSGN